MLDTLARGMRPELDADDPESVFDWIILNEIGLKIGFDDEAYLTAADESLRGKGDLLLTQLWFFNDGPEMQAFVHPLPFGLAWSQSRSEVRARLGDEAQGLRAYVNDAWQVQGVAVTAFYGDTGTLESLYCRLPERAWPRREPVTSLPAPEDFIALFGLRWTNARLRESLGMFGLESRLSEVRKHHVVDLRREWGLELYFAEAARIPAAEQRYPRSLVFSAVTYYAERELDARMWTGPLPLGLRFDDTQRQAMAKVPAPPAVQHNMPLSGYAVWHFTQVGLQLLYSNLENRLLRMTLMAEGFWPS